MAARRTAAQKAASKRNLAAARKKRAGARAQNRAFGLTGRGGTKRSPQHRAWAVADQAFIQNNNPGEDGSSRMGRAKKDPAKSLAAHKKRVAGKKAKAKKAVARRKK